MARKRKNGQGTVRLRSDGRWEGRHIVGYDENGKAKQKSVLAKTKAECVEKLKKLQEEYTEASFRKSAVTSGVSLHLPNSLLMLVSIRL